MFKGTSKATRNCIKKDKDLISSATYIAKEGLCIYNRGHTLDQVNEYIRIGNEKWKLSQLKKTTSHLSTSDYSYGTNCCMFH